MLSIEQRFKGAYLCALSEALIQTRVKEVVDAQISVLFDWCKSIIQGGVMNKRKTASLIELPIIFSLRFQRDPTSRIRFIKHLYLDCTKEEMRDKHDRALLRSAYLVELLEGRSNEEARTFVSRQYNGGILFSSHLDGLMKDGPLSPLPGDEKSLLPHCPVEARMFAAACLGAQFGEKQNSFADWQEELLRNKLSIKDQGGILFRVAYEYLGV